MSRRVKGLRFARELRTRPSCIPLGRARGPKALGVRYEKAFAKMLPEAEHGHWFEYLDDEGRHFCQVDFIWQIPSTLALVVLETKYTWVAEGHEQIEFLYAPVVQLARQLQVRPGGVVVCKSLTPETRGRTYGIYDDLEIAALSAHKDRRIVFQWLPGTGLSSRIMGERGKPVDSARALGF